MRLRAALVATIVAVAAVVGTAPTASAQTSSQVIFSGPLSTFTNYTTPLAVAEPGGELTYVNADAALHDVVSEEFGPDGQPWCTGDLAKPEGECPLFWTPLISLGKTTPVLGLENLESGQMYTFFCSIHRATMEGTLIAL